MWTLLNHQRLCRDSKLATTVLGRVCHVKLLTLQYDSKSSLPSLTGTWHILRRAFDRRPDSSIICKLPSRGGTPPWKKPPPIPTRLRFMDTQLKDAHIVFCCFEGSNTPYMLRIPVTKACTFNFRLEFYFNFGLKLPCAIYAVLGQAPRK